MRVREMVWKTAEIIADEKRIYSNRLDARFSEADGKRCWVVSLLPESASGEPEIIARFRTAGEVYEFFLANLDLRQSWKD